MNTQNFVQYSAFAFVCAVISAKWAMDLGYSQSRQILFGIGGLMCGPASAVDGGIASLASSRRPWPATTDSQR